MPPVKCDHPLNEKGECVSVPPIKCDHPLKDGKCEPVPPPVCDHPLNEKGECVPVPISDTCTLAPIETATKPNQYAVIEIGSKGIKPIAMEFKTNEKGELIPKGEESSFYPKPQNVTPREEVRIPDVVKVVCETINSFHDKYGKLPIYLVGSSAMAEVPHRAKLVAAIDKAIQIPVDFLNAEQEVSYLAKGIWVRPLPIKRHCESVVLDIGSGNIKGGYLEHCNPEKESPDEKLVTFEIPEFGTKAFSERATKKAKGKNISFNEAAVKTGQELEQEADKQIGSRPELTNGKKRIYLVGGAVWALNTLLCLDCPQYRNRSITYNQKEYTVIKPKDIEEFYKFVTQSNTEICDTSKENPYIKRNMDGGEMTRWEESDIAKQKDNILGVCQVFKASSDLVSAAEILRVISKEMGITESSHVFFMQKNLYTWSRQYLIEKIQQNRAHAN